MSSNNEPQANPDPSLKLQAETRLKARGIYDAATRARWQAAPSQQGEGGWSYPIFDPLVGDFCRNPQNGKPILRWKNFDKEQQGGNKYGWLYGQNGCPPYYVLPGTKEAIEAAEGLAYIAAGEVDVLTYISAGIANVFCWLNGEASVPNDLVELATELGIKRLIYLVDSDETGEKSAQTTAKRLSGSSIEFIAHRLPEYLGDKGDINDLWQWVEFDAERFAGELSAVVQSGQSLIATEPADYEPMSQVTANPGGNQKATTAGIFAAMDWQAERNEWIHSEVTPLLDQISPVVNREGRIERRHCPNPQHPDKNPSFRISYDVDSAVGIPQCSCRIQHEKHPWDLVAEWVGAEPFMEWWKDNSFAYLQLAISRGNVGEMFTADENSNPTNQGEYREMNEAANTTSPKGKRPAPTDDEIAADLMARWNGNYAHFLGRWYVYGNGVWKAEENIKGSIWRAMERAKSSGYKPSKPKADSIEACLAAMLFVSQIDIDNSDYINLKNGVYDVSGLDGEFTDHRRNLYLTSQLGFGYDPGATCPQWLQFLSEALVSANGEPDEQLIALLQEAIGYSLTTETNREACFWLYGAAASGKSTVLGVIRSLLGSAFISMDMNMLDANPYQLANLPGKRVVACSEAKVGSKLADHIIKALVSGEELSVRQIYGEPFTYKPVAKVWWAMNDQPQNLDRSNAIYRRLRIIPFNNPRSLDKQDPLLSHKLFMELPGIFNWALQGLERLRLNDKFTRVEQVEVALEEYKADNDTEAVFLNDIEWCCLDEQAQTQASDLYVAYSKWCERFNHTAKSSTKIAKDWQRLGLQKLKNGVVSYKGVALTDTAREIVRRNKPEDRNNPLK